MLNKNQIKSNRTVPSQMASNEKKDSREPWALLGLEDLCFYCGFPIGPACDCSRYDSEGNEL